MAGENAMSVKDALATLRAAVQTQRGRSALDTLENELAAGPQKPSANTTSGKPSGFPKKGQVPAALAAFQAKKNSAKGGATAS